MERRYPVLRQFDASEKVAPTTEDRKQQIKEQSIAGEISEAEFEREMEQVMDDGSSDRPSQSGNYTNVEIEDR